MSRLGSSSSGKVIATDLDIRNLNSSTDSVTAVVSGTVPLPTGASTLAEQQTQTTHLSAIETAVELLDNAISGNEMQVDIVGALPAGDNNIGNVDIVTMPTVTIDNSDVVSTNNSTTSVLSGGAVFTGTGDDCLGYTSVTITLKASHDSASSGMQFQFSPDNTNWDDSTNFTYTASNARRFQFPVTARYFRVVYTNGATLQTYFRVQTILHTQDILTTIHRVDDVLNTDRSATLTKSVMVGKVNQDFSISSATEGQYDNISLTQWRELRTRDQRAATLQDCNDYTSVTALGNDTTNIANSTNHVFGTGAITFDKVNGAANTVYAGVQDTITSINISEIFEDGAFVALACYLPSLSNVVNVFMRVGTDSSNYNEWDWPVSDLEAATWMALRRPTNQPSNYAGNGWSTTAVTYVAFGVEFSSETNTLAGIIFDNVHLVGGRITDSTIDASITSSVNTPNVNLHRVGGSPTDSNSGNLSAGTLRVAIATNDVNASAQTTSLQLIDDAIYTDGTGTPSKAIAIAGTDGTNPQIIKTDSNGELQVDVLTMPTVTVQATNLDIRDLVVTDVVSNEPDGTALSNNQVTVDTTVGGVTIVSASAGRQGVMLTNQGSVACYIGTGTVTASNGYFLGAGESVSIPTDSDVKGITASSSTTVGYLALA